MRPHLCFALDLWCIVGVTCGYLKIKQELAIAVVSLIWLDADLKVHGLLLALWEVDVNVAGQRQLSQVCKTPQYNTSSLNFKRNYCRRV